MNCLPALQSKNDGLDVNSVRKKAQPGGPPAAWQGPDLEKFPHAKTSKTAVLKDQGSKPLDFPL